MQILNKKGISMKHTFALTTRQVARLGGVEPYVIYSNLSRHGSWQGVTPRKLPTSRLLWPAAEVHSALGHIPDENAMSPGERSFVNFLDGHCVALTSSNFEIGQKLMSNDIDHGRDPSYYADEMVFLVEAVAGGCARLDQVLMAMDEDDRVRSMKALKMIASLASSFDDSKEGASHD
jgi:hypothetical protein